MATLTLEKLRENAIAAAELRLSGGGQGVAPVADLTEANSLEQRKSDAIARAEQNIPVQPEAQDDPNLLDRIGERLGERGDILQELTAAPPESTVESLGKGFQLLGNVVAGGALDVMGEVVSTGFNSMTELASKLTPDIIEDPIVNKVKEAFTSAVGTDIAQAGIRAAGQGIEAYQAWANENPEAAKNINAAANIALVALPVKGKPKVSAIKAPVKAGRLVRGAKALEAGIVKKRASFVDDLIKPLATKKVREAEIKRSVEGVGAFGARRVTPNTIEAQIAGTVTNLKGVKNSNTLLQNLNEVQKGLTQEANDLSTLLKGSKVKIPRLKTNQTMGSVLTKLQNETLLVGDAVKTGEKVLDRAMIILKSNPNTPAGILKSRKQLDAWVKKQSTRAFDPATENALSVSLREVRQAMNGIIGESVPNIAVKSSLKAQSNLFRAIDNIAPKAAKEAETAIGRLVGNVSKSLGVKSILDPKMTLALSALGFGALASPTTTVGIGSAILATKGVQKAVTSSATKKALSKMLRLTDQAIRKSNTNGAVDVVKTLRADRAALVEIFNTINADKGE